MSMSNETVGKFHAGFPRAVSPCSFSIPYMADGGMSTTPCLSAQPYTMLMLLE